MINTLRTVVSLFDKPTRVRLILALLGSVVVSSLEAVAVIAVLPLMDLLTGNTDSAWLARIRPVLGDPDDRHLAAYVALIVFAGFLVKGLVSMAIRWWSQGFMLAQGIRSSSELLRYYLNAPYTLHLERGAPDLLRTLNEAVAAVYALIVMGGMSVLAEGITIIVIAISLLVVAPGPTLAVSIYFGVAAFVLQRTVKKHARQAGQQILHGSFLQTQAALHALGGIKEITLRHEADTFVRHYADARAITARATRVSTFVTELPRYLMELLFIFGVGLMTTLVYATDRSGSTLGLITLFGVAGFRILPSIIRMIASITQMRSGVPSLRLVDEDIRASRAMPTPAQRSGPRLPFAHEVRLEGIHFRYPRSSRDVLDDINLVIPAGSSLALVGSSGSGKTTLVDLLLGLHQPSSGRVLVDDRDVTEDLAGWQRNLAMVPQDVYLLDDSIRENIRFSPDADDPDDQLLTAAIDRSQLRDVVDELPHGVDTHVGDRGARLSGGQRQRVGIARALFREPKLLVLDEATSALDNETEREITDTITTLRGEVTVVVVAHRLSTVRHCDRIALMSEGRIVDAGTFAELRERSPQFARMVHLGSLDS